jgi:hypothetical protein
MVSQDEEDDLSFKRMDLIVAVGWYTELEIRQGFG